VLKLIAAKTGAVVDLAPELQNEPVVAHLGPASAREVLTALLDSPGVDYIVMAGRDNPDSLERLVVRTRQAFARVAMAAVRPPQPRQEEAQEEPRLDENGHLATGSAAADANLTQEQRMEIWKKTREEMRQAEIKQQAEDREKEKTQPQTEPQPEPVPAQQDNPPQA
jgi:flagellar biosynthesis GTPase FlhF